MRVEIERLLSDAARSFRAQPGILSVDFTHMNGDPGRYLVVFRYVDAAAREAFQHTSVLKETMARLCELWDLESPVWQGHQTGL
jgi:quinol monooxygenase YgiN